MKNFKLSEKPQLSDQINLGATFYDFNKSLSAEEKPLTELELVPLQEKIANWFNMECDCYAMLLCHDRRDYTVFHMYQNPPANQNPPAVAARECFGCLTDRGEIISIDPTRDHAWEIWLRIDGEDYCYFLFCYDRAVIEC